MGIGITEGILIAAIVILLFGAKKIPQLGKTLGESIKGFKEGMHTKGEDEKKGATKIENMNDDNKKS
jgi:sec-independent protein translocase protein TatA